MQAELPVCAGLPILLRCIRYVLAHTVLPICHQSAWLRRCTLILWVPNFGVQEYMGYSEPMLEVFPHNWTFDNGYMHPGDKPGLGIEFDEKLAAKYPYEPAYLPVARLEDGTLWNW
ncbi:enolase C-terminal domain-like protein [Escherichia coli]